MQTRREFLRSAAAGAAGLALAGRAGAAPEKPGDAMASPPGGVARADRPDLVLILADDLGWGELGCFGSKKIRTPSIDRIAAEGMADQPGHDAPGQRPGRQEDQGRQDRQGGQENATRGRDAMSRIARYAAIGSAVAAAALAAPAGAQTKGDAKVALTPERMADRIRQHRAAEVTLTLVDAAGKPIAGRQVTVRQTAHKFLFGCNAFKIDPADESQLQKDYQKRYAELLNFATLPFYWGAYERTPGQTNAQRVRAMAEWCRRNGIRTKGHPLCWHEVFPRWGSAMPLEEVWKLQVERVGREVKGFAGLIDTWDVVNEAVVLPSFRDADNPLRKLCEKMGRVEIIKQTFAAAVQANPKATFLLNDFDTSPKYEQLIEECLKAGVRIDTIGIQSHMHGGYRGAEWAWKTCQQFARFGKPLHFTELTICSGEERKDIRWAGPRYEDWPTTPAGEERQARQVEEFYTVLFSHPAVEAITWWDFSDHSAWLGAPSGLTRKDMSPKPAYEKLLTLAKGKWWNGPVRVTTDGQGKATFRGYLGSYAVEGEDGKPLATFRVETAGKADVTAR